MRPIKQRLIKPISWLYLAFLAAMFVWALIYDFTNTIITIGVWVVVAMVLVAVCYVFLVLQERFMTWRRIREMKRLLDGRSLDELLEKSPYTYDYEQGLDGPFIFVKPDRDAPEQYLYMTSPYEARMWIVRQAIASEKGCNDYG